MAGGRQESDADESAVLGLMVYLLDQLLCTNIKRKVSCCLGGYRQEENVSHH
jgi:hypothetical protein